MHHKGKEFDIHCFSKDYYSILTEEEAYFEYSSTIVAKNDLGCIVGAIRITNWNDNPHTLPINQNFW